MITYLSGRSDNVRNRQIPSELYKNPSLKEVKLNSSALTCELNLVIEQAGHGINWNSLSLYTFSVNPKPF